MTEKDVYKKGVALLEEWEDVNYCEHSFKFKDEWLTDKEVVDLLNELHEEKEQLKKQLQKIHKLIDDNIRIYEDTTTNDDFLQIQLDTKLQTLYNLRKELFK